MRIYRFTTLVLIITAVALLYVHQQFVLVKVSYQINSKEKKFNQLLDQNKILEYNVSNLKSPLNLYRYKNNFQIASSNQIMDVHSKNISGKRINLAKGGGFNILAFFSLKRQAEARTIK